MQRRSYLGEIGDPIFEISALFRSLRAGSHRQF
jgi:hypothetical protein